MVSEMITQKEIRADRQVMLTAMVALLLLVVFAAGALLQRKLLAVELDSSSVVLTLERPNDRYFHALELGTHGVHYNSGYHPCSH